MIEGLAVLFSLGGSGIMFMAGESMADALENAPSQKEIDKPEETTTMSYSDVFAHTLTFMTGLSFTYLLFPQGGPVSLPIAAYTTTYVSLFVKQYIIPYIESQKS